MHFLNRHIASLIEPLNHETAMFVLTGARQTGKTTFCENLLPAILQKPVHYISFDDPDERARFQRSGIAILESIHEPIICLDEVQKLPSVFDAIKFVFDKYRKSEASKTFILTGSSQIMLMKEVKESLAGRVTLLNIYPFSLSELQSKQNILLTELWGKRAFDSNMLKTFEVLSAEYIRSCKSKRDEHQYWGGYPPIYHINNDAMRLRWLKDYRGTYIDKDISTIGQISDIDTFAITQKVLCSRTAQILNLNEVAKEVSISANTVKRYIQLLYMSFHCYTLQPYYQNVGKRLIKSPKIYFPDVGLNKAILGRASISEGANYETWVFAELIKWRQLQSYPPELYYYRTSSGFEIDFFAL